MSKACVVATVTSPSAGRWREPQVALAWAAIIAGVAVTLVLSSIGVGSEGIPVPGSPATPATGLLPSEGPAAGAATSNVLLFLPMLLGLTLGVILCARAVLRLVRGRWVSRLEGAQRRHQYYVEAFALWLVLGIPASIVSAALRGWTGLPGAVEDALLHPLGLLVLLWPRWRGVPLAVMCHDVGLHRGEGALREVGAGLVGYLAKWPLFLLGILVTTLLARLAGDASIPAHPVTHALSAAGPEATRAILVTAIVLAPLLEEVLFRGLLLRHLRSLDGPFAAASRPVGAALISALVFAAVHPQGLLAVPALLAEGFALAMIVDWRGSLIASITAHAVHNGILMFILV
jgi:membrane protease YdiL (CAAX protease family)